MAAEKYSFRCNNCGRLETSENAGERDFPAACRSCGAGVSFHPTTGIKQYHEDNWTVLADLSPEELEAIRVVKKEKSGESYAYWDEKDVKIVKHKAAPNTVPEGREPQMIERTAEEHLGAEDVVS